jgi:eukaryotic-like serine/threonine-protein kinase
MANRVQTAEDIFATAIDLPIELRLAYVESVCRGSEELHGEVIALLADHQRLGDFLEKPPIAAIGGVGNVNLNSTISSGPPSAGRRLGRYTILGPIGVGGMGAVYRARDERLEREVAIKTLFPELLLDEHSRGRFRKEALALARLNHANIAAVHDVGEEDGVDYIVMEFITGETLAARLKRGPLAIAEAMSMVRQVAQALEEAHEFGVIHRDLKPGNIMITLKGTVKVLDFGIAKFVGLDVADPRTADAATCIGTPFYMSPERIQGKTVDVRTDLWSLGVVLYESLTGCRPFCGDSLFATMQAIVDTPPIPVVELRPEAPASVQGIVTRLLRKDVDLRFQSAEEVMRETSAALSGLLPIADLQA